MIEKWVTGPQLTQFYTRTYLPTSGPPRALIVFLHGFAEHTGRYSHIHPKLSERQVALWTFDQRGKTVVKKSSWGKTSWSDQMQDLDWAVKTAMKEVPGVPTFLFGHSMGGGEVLSFVTQQSYAKPEYAETVASLTGVIITSPLIRQTTPAAKLLRWFGGKVAIVSPYTLIPADVDAKYLSHSPEFNEAYVQDPLIKSTGSLKGLGDMLTEGEKLLSVGCHQWPKKLPVLFMHGDEDKVTSVKATQEFCERIDADDKKIIIYPGGYHELQSELPDVRQQLVSDIVSFVLGHISSKPTMEPSPSAGAGGTSNINTSGDSRENPISSAALEEGKATSKLTS
ncbi:alpha beta-hydrolase [Rhodocollybia butyracea]|uniref:Alpha beta-hydrolase n=1 Tax=Rhodocollybia butyracea TaxID=206335 RepID=A0A9P5UDY2_9AGAR|nr:alpha beta-hydrolase [Rhodocollybia butyracea]